VEKMLLGLRDPGREVAALTVKTLPLLLTK